MRRALPANGVTLRRAVARWLVAIWVAAAPAAAAPGLTTSAGERLILEVGERTTVAVHRGGRLKGPAISLRRTRSVVAGRWLDRGVALELEPGVVRGRWAADPVSLSVSRQGAAIIVEGPVGAGRAELRAGPSEIRGAVGRCTYTLRAAALAYRGFRVCEGAGLPVPVRLTLPKAAAGNSDESLAALLVVVLAPLEPALGSARPEPAR